MSRILTFKIVNNLHDVFLSTENVCMWTMGWTQDTLGRLYSLDQGPNAPRCGLQKAGFGVQ